MPDWFSHSLALALAPGAWSLDSLALLNVIMIDVVLAGDNAIVVGMAAARVHPSIRAKVIFWGIAAAVALRIAFASLAQVMLAVVGLTLAGGILLLWVCWKMYRQMSSDQAAELAAAEAGLLPASGPADVPTGGSRGVGFWPAVGQIALADVSMSLDNVLAVAGAAGQSLLVLVIGLVVAIVLMAIASHVIAKLLVRHAWITWIGLAIILFVACDMVYRGTFEVLCGPASTGCHDGLFQSILSIMR